VRTSDALVTGELYTRQQLRDMFGIADQTINTGIFRPAGHDSIWLFVTEEKSPGMTEYADRLEGDILRWQGQTAGVKDPQIIEHAASGTELIVFYRERKDAYPGYAFRFEGAFEYVSHDGALPASFILRRVAPTRQGTDEPLAASAGGLGAGELCLVDKLAQLRQSGRDSVVADGSLTALQRRMHVPDRIEDWVAGRIAAWRSAGPGVPLLIVLSGNAGDGKSDLIERLRVREGVRGDDLDVVADATHAETPSQSQAARLTEALSLFTSESAAPLAEPRCVLLAMNVGMVIAFFSALESSAHETRFAALQAVLEHELGLAREPAEPPAHWECEVVNLDHRNLLGREHDGLLSGILAKLDPESPGSVTYEAAQACAGCPVRASCWVRTNLSLLRLPVVRDALHELLWEVTLGGDVHLSPRNIWDMLYQVTTGGIELADGQFLSCDWLREHLPASARDFTPSQLPLVQRRLLYQLLFEAADRGAPSRGAILDALTAADPIRRGGRHTHLAEGEVRAAPAADAPALSELALAADEPQDGGRRPDPLLDALASLAEDPAIWREPDAANANDLALGVSRRGRVTGLPAEIQAEVSDQDAGEFLVLLRSYASWAEGGGAPDDVEAFWLTALVGGVGEIFGVEVQDKTYFRLDTLSPATRFPAFVPVDLRDKISVEPDGVAASGAPWLGAVSYLPRAITATVDAGGEDPWRVPVDLQLYRLLRQVNRGYAASSVDLHAFFRLRYACERLGTTGPEGEIIFRSVVDGRVLRLRRERRLSSTYTALSRAQP
jgi:hypothetical protein